MVNDPYSALIQDVNRNNSTGMPESDGAMLGQTLEMLERRNQELQLLHKLAIRLNKTLETKAAMEVGLDLILELTGAQAIGIVLINREESHFDLVASKGIDAELAADYAVTRFNRAVYQPGMVHPETTRNLIEYMILTRRSLTTRDLQAMPRFDLKTIFESGYQSVLAIPVHFDDQVFGLVMLGSKQPDRFDQHTVQLGEHIAAQLGLALRNQSLFANLTRRVEQIQGLVETGTRLQYAPHTHTFLPRVLRTICKVFHADNAAVFLLNGSEFDVVGAAEPLVLGPKRPVAPHHQRLLDSDKPLTVHDRTDPDTDPNQRAAMERAGRRAAMGVRLYARDRAFGLLFVNQIEPRIWRSDEEQLLKAFAQQIAHALENKRLLEESQIKVRELGSLSKVGRLIATSNPPDSALYTVADEIARVFGADYVSFHLREGEFMRLVAESKLSGAPEFLPIQPYQLRILAELDPIRVNDSEQDAVNLQQRDFLRQYHIRADLGVPLLSEHMALGILYLSQNTPRVWSDQDVALAETFAQQIAGALTNARLFRESQSRVRELRALTLNANLIAFSRSPENALPQAASDLRRVLSADYVGFHLLEADELVVVTEAHHGYGNLRYRIQPYHRIVLDHAQKLVIYDREKDTRDEIYRAALTRYGFKADVGVPMVARGKTIGILFVSQRENRLWRDTEIQLIETYAQQIATVLENVQLLNEQERRVTELEQLTDLNEMAATILGEDALIEMAMGLLKQLLQADRVSIATIENGELRPARSSDGVLYPRQPMPKSKELEAFLGSRRPLIVDPLHPPQYLGDFKERARFYQVKAYMTFPLMSVNDTLGILSFMYFTDHVFTEGEIRLAQAAANQLAMAFANARLLRDQKKRIDKLGRLAEFGLWCGTVRESASLIEQAATRVTALLDATAASIRMFNGDALTIGAGSGYKNPEAREHPISVTPNLHRILYQYKPYPIPDLETEPNVPQRWRERHTQEGFRSLLMVPMIAEDKVIGILAAFYDRVRNWDDAEIQYAQTLANTLALAYANELQIERARAHGDELAATLDSVFSGVFTTDLDGRILTWNNAASKITGFSRKEMCGKLWHVDGPRAGAHRRDDMLVFEAMAGQTACFSLVPRYLTGANGDVIELREAAAPLRDGKGQVRGAVCAFWDRTVEQAAERAKVDFINLVAHQLDSKLTALIWSAEQLQRPDLSTENRADFFEIFSGTLDELRAFNKSFIQFQREHSQQEIESSQVDLQLFLQAKTKVWRKTHPTHKYLATGDLPTVLADELRLDVVIDNLLDNATKYSPPHSTITLRGRRLAPDVLELSIHNAGAPIAPELLPRLFERFARGDSNQPGTGLGLWLVRTKLHEMGGDIRVVSPHRGGTTFYVRLGCKPTP